jgi:DNA (cytosine-5)-methyltransferase 1
MKHGSLFSGIGGFDLAAEWMGWENVFHCEIEKFPRKVLKYHFPKAISYEDIKQTDFTIHRGQIDILTGGFPCQPFSLAGKRKGTEDARNLWPEYHRAIREIQPRFVVGENVYGLVNWSGGLVFEQVQSDLENEGYQVAPVILPACSVGAPHKRERVWFVAYSESKRSRRKWHINRSEWIQPDSEGWQRMGQQCSDIGGNGATPDTESQSSERMQLEQQKFSEQEQGQFGGNSCGMGNRTTPYTNKQRQQERNNAGQPGKQRWFNGFIPPHENWEKFPTQPPVRGGNDGIPDRLDSITFPKWRNESIKAYGNAIVPQVAFEIFKAIECEIINMQ